VISITPHIRRLIFETLYKNRYLYRFASTVPFAGQWRVWQRLVLPRIHGHDVLELGCGLGDLLADMLAAGYNCRAIEHSPQMAAAARATLRKRNIGSPAWIIQGVAQQLPFADQMFDTIVSTFPNEYIFDSATIMEAARVLRPGGRIIIVEAGNLLPVGYLQSLLLPIHRLVYGTTQPGRVQQHVPATARHTDTMDSKNTRERQSTTDNTLDNTLTTDELSATMFGSLIPLEQANLYRYSERVRSPRWEVYITIGEKSV
jgi:Methylase involved in ubiquinone/menaquinone biosynthesis